MAKELRSPKSTFAMSYWAITTELVVFLGLSWMVVLNIFEGLDNYAKGVTSFAKKTELVTYLDQPTVTVCFLSKIEYKLGFNIKLTGVTVSKTFNFGYDGLHEIIDNLGKTHLMSINMLSVRPKNYAPTDAGTEQCLKISTVSSQVSDGTNAYVRKAGDTITVDDTEDPPATIYFTLTLDDISKEMLDDGKALVHFTSEANAYGVVGDFREWQGVTPQWY